MKLASTLTSLALLAAVFAAPSCTEKTPDPLTANDGGSSDEAGDGGDSTTTSPVPANACADSADSIYADPGAALAGAAKGDIFKCNKGKVLAKTDLQAKLDGLGYQGKPMTSGAQAYTISYRTERGDTAGTAAVSSAIVYFPDTPRAAKLPIVVAGRGSRGQAQKCAVSKLDPSLDNGGVNDDFYRMVWALAGQGYAVITPDLAGYVSPPPSAYAQAADVGKSTLDGSRAMKNLFPTLDEKLVLVGHSQGGHSVLAALALSSTYGGAAPIAAVATYSPLWLSQRSWGAILYHAIGKDYDFQSSAAGPVSVWYHYTQAELLDGPGEGKKLFAPGKQDAVKAFVDNDCWGDSYPDLVAVGADPAHTYADELFDPAFDASVGFKAAFGGDCGTDAVCAKWIARYSADRPHITGDALSVPILLMYGGMDTTIPPNRMKCALDRLGSDGVKLTSCVEPTATHSSIVSLKADYAGDWIAAQVLGAPAPAACASDASAVTVACATPPPND